MPEENYPNEGMIAEAKRGLEWRREYGRGGTAVGVARARDIARRANLSDDTIRRMNSYFARHEVDKKGEGFSPGEPGYPSAGRIAWALWGGDPGQRWAAAWVRRKDSNNNDTTMKILSIENKAAKLRLDEQVDSNSIKPLVQEIERVFGHEAAQNGLVTGDITACIDNAADTLDIEIHSPGGSVMDGYVLYNAIKDMRERGVYVTAHVQLAASMASVIAMAADRIVMREGGRMMIHDASAVTMGNAEEHLGKANLLESISDEIAGIYSGRTGMDKKAARALMKKETWMDGKEAVSLGFADESFDTQPKGMTGILSKLFPGNDEVAKLEAAIADADSLRNDLTAAQNRIDELAPLAEVNAKLQADLNELTAKITEADKLANENAETIAELKAEVEAVDEKAAIKAAELLAQQGHPAPVALIEEGTETKNILEQFEALKGGEATAFYRKHRKAILAAQAKL